MKKLRVLGQSDDVKVSQTAIQSKLVVEKMGKEKKETFIQFRKKKNNKQ